MIFKTGSPVVLVQRQLEKGKREKAVVIPNRGEATYVVNLRDLPTLERQQAFLERPTLNATNLEYTNDVDQDVRDVRPDVLEHLANGGLEIVRRALRQHWVRVSRS